MPSLMSSSMVATVVLIILCLASKGLCACDLNDMLIGTVRSGKEIQGQAEWNVTFTNRCPCPIKTVTISCTGFQSTEPVSSSVLKVNGDQCLLYNGIPLKAGGSFTFSYAWNSPFILTPIYILPMGC